MIFRKYYCLVCGKQIKWHEKVIVEDKISKITDHTGNTTLYKHEEMTHSKCASDELKERLKADKKSKKKRKDDSNDTSNVDCIYSD